MRRICIMCHYVIDLFVDIIRSQWHSFRARWMTHANKPLPKRDRHLFLAIINSFQGTNIEFPR
jgi:hypothetical protein